MAFIKGQKIFDFIREKALNGDDEAKDLLRNLPNLNQDELDKKLEGYSSTDTENDDVDFLINDEKEAINGYNRALEKISDEKIKKIYNFIINEEENHIKWLTSIKNGDIDEALNSINEEEH